VNKGGKWLPQKYDVSNLSQLALVPKEHQGSLFSYQDNKRNDESLHQVNEPIIVLEIHKDITYIKVNISK
jgi:hypothetical protein